MNIYSQKKIILIILLSTHSSQSAQLPPIQQASTTAAPATSIQSPFDAWLAQTNNAISQLNSMAQQLLGPNNIERIKNEAMAVVKEATTLGILDPALLGNIAQALAAKNSVGSLIQSTQTVISASYTRHSNPYNPAVVAEITRLNTVIHGIATDITSALATFEQSLGQISQTSASAGVSVNLNVTGANRPNAVMRSDLSPRVSGVAEVTSIAQAGAQINGFLQALRSGTSTAGTVITMLRGIVTKKNNLIARYNWIIQNTQPIKNAINQMSKTYQTLAPQANQAVTSLRQSATTTAQLNAANTQASTLSSLANRITTQITSLGSALTSVDNLCAQINQKLTQK